MKFEHTIKIIMTVEELQENANGMLFYNSSTQQFFWSGSKPKAGRTWIKFVCFSEDFTVQTEAWKAGLFSTEEYFNPLNTEANDEKADYIFHYRLEEQA